MGADAQARTETVNSVSNQGWDGGVVGGLVGAIVMGAMIWLQQPAVLDGAIPAMYTLEGAAVGWVAHLLHGALFGLMFVAFLQMPLLNRLSDTVVTAGLVGLLYGGALWVVAAGIIMPVWLQTLGFAGAPAVPNWTISGSLIPHLVYGVLLGVVYPFFAGR